LTAEQQLLDEQRQRDKRLAQAQNLREIAQRNGNLNLLATSARMEADAIEHYARRVAQLERFGVTDPALNPAGAMVPTPARNVPGPTPASGAPDPLLTSVAPTAVPADGRELKSVLVKPKSKRP
jgi:hypothetical protein